MKKIFLAVLLVVNITSFLYAEEAAASGGSGKGSGGEFGGDLRLGYSFPFLDKTMYSHFDNSSEDPALFIAKQTLLSFAFSSVSLGGGFHYTVVPHVFAPGLWVDVHFNFLSWLLARAFTDNNFIMLQTGIRFYNQFSVDIVSFEPFFGFNLAYVRVDEHIKLPIPLMAAGFAFNVDRFSFEYGYNFLPVRVDGRLPGIHRITFASSLLPK